MSKIRKIFIVDDDVMFRHMLADYLTSSSFYEITEFGTGEECLKRLMQDPPEMIILDYFLNAVSQDAANGMIILEKILHEYPFIHVIMLSGQDKYGVAAKTIAKGAEHYVMKGQESFKQITQIIAGYN